MSRRISALLLRPANARLLRSASLALLLSTAAVAPAFAAIGGRLEMSQAGGFGRIVFDLDQATRARTHVSNGILIIDFDEPVSLNVEKVPLQMPDYIGVARLDPDGKAVRFALKLNYRVNLMDAGEKLFVDLLPPSWSGMPPGLPQDVVDALAKRARKAEEELRKVQYDRARRVPHDIAVKVINGPGFARIVMPVKQDVPVDFNRTDDGATLTIDSALRFDARTIKPDLPPAVTAVTAALRNGMLEFALVADKQTEIRGFRDNDDYLIDIVPPPVKAKAVAPAPAAEKVQKAAQPAPHKPEASGPDHAAQTPAGSGTPLPPAPAVTASTKPQPAPVVSGPVTPTFERAGKGLRITLPFAVPVAAAAFQRGGTLWLVFEDRQPIVAPAVPELASGVVGAMSIEKASGAIALRLPLQRPAILNFAQQGNAWVATIGGDGLAAAVPIDLKRDVSPEGRTVLKARLPNAGAVHWFADRQAGDSIAVVTAQGPAHGMAKRYRFVEFSALATAHGLALVPNADDLMVTAGLDDVSIGRGQGLMLSSLPAREPEAPAPAGTDTNLDPKVWDADSSGNIRETQARLMQAAADAPQRERSEARLRLARFHLANGFYPEAMVVLQALSIEDEAAAVSKPVLMSMVMASVLGGRYRQAEKVLASPVLSLDPEAVLWRAVLDARTDRWGPALVGFRKSVDIIDRYPDGLKSVLSPLVIDAALNGNDPGFAMQQLQRFEKLSHAAPDPGVLALEHGRVAAALGRDESAVNYLQTAAKGNRMVEASARLELVLLKLKNHQIEAPAAIAELETIGAIWRRDDVEVRALATLGDLYAKEGRWREAFAATQRATQIMPDHPLTRGLQDKMARAFSALFLDGKDEGLSKVEALGLYYDFKEFTPPGRDGDEMIRHLADRLADLDLLDQAGILLHHQVEHRLEGVARAQVAARLAVIDLMNRKPAEAVEVLRSTRMGDLPAELKRARSLLEARGLSELSLTDLAVEILAPHTGEDANRLRADILWRGKRWREAGEAFETVLGDRWQKPDPLNAAERLDVLRAGIGYVLANETIGLDRLRSKFAAKMSDSADARTFNLVAGDTAGNAREFRELARTVISVGTLPDFLDSFRARYPDLAGPKRKPKTPAAPAAGQAIPPKTQAGAGAADGKPAEAAPADAKPEAEGNARPAESAPKPA